MIRISLDAIAYSIPHTGTSTRTCTEEVLYNCGIFTGPTCYNSEIESCSGHLPSSLSFLCFGGSWVVVVVRSLMLPVGGSVITAPCE